MNGFLDIEASRLFKQFVVFSEQMLSQKSYNFIKLPVFDSFYNQMRTTSNYHELISIRSSKEVLVLRKDMTYQVASYIASLKERVLPMRLYYEGEVFSWQKEITSDYQLGMEYIGYQQDPEGVLEIVDIIHNLLGFFEKEISVYISDEHLLKELLNTFDKKDRNTLQDALKSKNLNVLSYYSLDWIFSDTDEVFKHLDKLNLNYSKLKNVFGLLKEKYDVKLDISEIKPIPYYEGITFSFYSPNFPFVIASGGEYKILKDVYNLDIKACGGAIYLMSILEALS